MSGDYPYKRKTLFKNKMVEVVLVTWPPGCVSRAHDHGESCGLIRVISGTLFEQRYSKKQRVFLEQLTHQKGTMIFETPDIIHIMGNVSTKKEAQSLHVYMPPPQMTFYDDL